MVRNDPAAVDLKAAAFAVAGLKPIPAAITTHHDGRDNGLMSLSLAAGGIVPEAPRVTISITKYNFSHDLLASSGAFVAHVLGSAPELLDASLEIFMRLGGSSGRDGEKLTGLDLKRGVTGAPILVGALAYVECRVVASLDAEENTIFLADVVAAERQHGGAKLDIGTAWGMLPADWLARYEANHHPQEDDCRRRRGLAPHYADASS
jgi:flavin reductase (DIM6/NTAB) family NADH-FMN oxidoreductase RutF